MRRPSSERSFRKLAWWNGSTLLTRTSCLETLPSQVSARIHTDSTLVVWGHAVCPGGSHVHTRSAVSQRGVVFFRAQDDLTNDLQKKLMLRLGELTGRPKTSGLHIHPLLNENLELGGDDPEISTISSKQFNKLRIGSNKGNSDEQTSLKKQNNAQWHSDIGFEPVPADYTSLRLVQLPETGGGECPPFSPMYSPPWGSRDG